LWQELLLYFFFFYVGAITWSDGEDIEDESEEGAVPTRQNRRTRNEEE